eukprot:scaffold86394_cov31-Tisochrysis_lutea.AAC.1
MDIRARGAITATEDGRGVSLGSLANMYAPLTVTCATRRISSSHKEEREATKKPSRSVSSAPARSRPFDRHRRQYPTQRGTPSGLASCHGLEFA